MERLDAVVVGAGVVGLAVARELALAGREVVVLDAEDAIGTHTSTRTPSICGSSPSAHCLRVT